MATFGHMQMAHGSTRNGNACNRKLWLGAAVPRQLVQPDKHALR